MPYNIRQGAAGCKGFAVVNDKQDAIDWQEHYRYNILTSNNSLVG